MMPKIRAAGTDDRPDWERLWAANCAHFGAAGMPEAVIDGLWRRIVDAGSPMQAWLAADQSGAIALAHTILHPHTFSLAMVCYLEDLWVSPEARGRGVATGMIGHLTAVGRQQGWRRLYWETGDDNGPARRLYDRVASRRPTITYQIDITA